MVSKEREIAVGKESFCFDKLPTDLQRAVSRKLNFPSWFSLRSCSRSANNACDVGFFRRTLQLTRIEIDDYYNLSLMNDNGTQVMSLEQSRTLPWRFTCSMFNFDANLITSEFIEHLCIEFEKQQVSIDVIKLEESVLLCSGQELADLMELVGATKLISYIRLDCDFFAIPYAQHLQEIILDECFLTDVQFLDLRIPRITLLNYDSPNGSTCGKALKEWQEGERELEFLKLYFDLGDADFNPIDVLIEGLHVNPIWNPEIHRHSLASDATILNNSYFYALWRTNDVFDTFILELQSDFLLFFRSSPGACLRNLVENYSPIR